MQGPFPGVLATETDDTQAANEQQGASDFYVESMDNLLLTQTIKV